jgi:mRNA turnover protein 4
MGGRNKRNKKMTLSKTKKKDPRDRKLKIVKVIEDNIKKFTNAFLFTYENMTTN